MPFDVLCIVLTCAAQRPYWFFSFSKRGLHHGPIGVKSLIPPLNLIQVTLDRIRILRLRKLRVSSLISPKLIERHAAIWLRQQCQPATPLLHDLHAFHLESAFDTVVLVFSFREYGAFVDGCFGVDAADVAVGVGEHALEGVTRVFELKVLCFVVADTAGGEVARGGGSGWC